MQEFKIKNLEIFKCNNERFISQVIDRKTEIHKISLDDENNICNNILDLAYANELGIPTTVLGINDHNEYYVRAYSENDTNHEKHYYLKYMRRVKDPQIIGLDYIVYCDSSEGTYKFIIMKEGKIAEIKDIKEELLDGKIFNPNPKLQESRIETHVKLEDILKKD